MSWQNVDDLNIRQEIVKCVVVGDTAVGKTRLICARACDAYLTLPQMLSTHIPTVWAIDQYRIHKEVLKKSWMIVDGVNVALRLWDTFGDHEKDRKFAYGRSDVVLLCFSISSLSSFRHCKTKWYPEIRKNCPDVPIVLVGCKNDLRHVCRDEQFLQQMRERSPFLRIAQESQLISREEGRQLASDIGAAYYESSVWTHYGVETVFENAMRLALIARRQQRFWVKRLRNVISPVLQVPFCPPKPNRPVIEVLASTYEEEMSSLLDKELAIDMTLLMGRTTFNAHKVILAAASSYFKQIFISSSNKEKKMVSLPTFAKLSPTSIRNFIRFLYTGDLLLLSEDLDDFQTAVKITDIWELKALTDLHGTSDEERNDLRNKFYKRLQENLKKFWVENLFTDVTFDVDDGTCLAHRSVLMARCPVMKAMLGGDFKESTADIVSLPGVSKNVFVSFLHYLYTDTLEETIPIENSFKLIELANRMCLPRLITLVEFNIIENLQTMELKGEIIKELTITLLEPSQVHNAFQLAEWCQYYIMTNYQDISLNYSKLISNLHQDNQAHLNKNRWPPLHFLKEQEFYERCVREQELCEKPQKFLLWKMAKKKVSGCLGPKNKILVSGNQDSDPIRIRSLSS